jgi:NTE family protein
MTTAFVLSGGGSLGAVQVGMMQALTDLQISPDLLVGTSVGALNAAYVAGHGTGHEALQQLAGKWAGVRRRHVFPFQPARHLLAVAGARASLCSAEGLRRLVAAHLSYADLERSRIPVHIVATNLLSGGEVLLSDGDALTAVLASSAIPGVFAPVERGGQTLVDGAFADNAAISQAVALGADRVYVLPTGYACDLARAPVRPIATALHALGVLIQQRLINDVAFYANRVELTVLPPLCPLKISPANFSRSAELIERARSAARRWLDGPTRVHPEDVLALHDHSAAATQAGRPAQPPVISGPAASPPS